MQNSNSPVFWFDRIDIENQGQFVGELIEIRKLLHIVINFSKIEVSSNPKTTLTRMELLLQRINAIVASIEQH